MLSLFGNSRHLETNAKIFSPYLLSILYIMKKHPFRGKSINQFSTILGVESYVWNLLQEISEAG